METKQLRAIAILTGIALCLFVLIVVLTEWAMTWLFVVREALTLWGI